MLHRWGQKATYTGGDRRLHIQVGIQATYTSGYTGYINRVLWATYTGGDRKLHIQVGIEGYIYRWG